MSAILKGYFKETRQPIYSAALLLPFFLLYHIGSLLMPAPYVNGADALILRILSMLTVHSIFGSALVLIGCFVVWQLRTHGTWKIHSGMLALCFLESCCFALLLLFAFGWLNNHIPFAMAAKRSGLMNLVLYCGAGIYEELVFRAFLLGLLVAGFNRIFPKRKAAANISAVVLGALLFSAFHYIGSEGDAFTLAGFVQRTVGGLYFSILFVTRGYGVTAVSHAIYDIIVGIIL
jgi:hypothetical protein